MADRDEMKHFYEIMQRNRWIIAITVLVSIAVSIGLNLRNIESWTATKHVEILLPDRKSLPGPKRFVNIVTRQSVLQEVAKSVGNGSLSISELSESVEAYVSASNPREVVIVVHRPDKEEAKEIVDTVFEVARDEVLDMASEDIALLKENLALTKSLLARVKTLRKKGTEALQSGDLDASGAINAYMFELSTLLNENTLKLQKDNFERQLGQFEEGLKVVSPVAVRRESLVKNLVGSAIKAAVLGLAVGILLSLLREKITGRLGAH